MNVTPTGKSRFAPVQIIDSRQAIELVKERIVAQKLNAKAHATLAARAAGKSHVSLASNPSIAKNWNTSLFTTFVPWAWALGERLYSLDDSQPVFFDAMSDVQTFGKKINTAAGHSTDILPPLFKERGIGSGMAVLHLLRGSVKSDIRLKTLIDMMAFYDKPIMFGQPR